MNKKYLYSIIALTAIAAILFCASFIKEDPVQKMESQARTMEKNLQKRERILDRYCYDILSGKTSLKDEAGLPEDMVIYHYKNDTLHCWINEFPIANDDIKADLSYYRLHHLQGTDQAYITPLAYLSGEESYTSLGSGWYFVKTFRQGEDYLIGAICIKREYVQESMSYANEVNPNLKLDSKYTTAPLSDAASATVHSCSAEPLFSVVETSRSHYSYGFYPLHWAVILLLAIATLLMHLALRNKYSFAAYCAVLLMLALWARRLTHICDPSSPLFSPLTYAGNSLLDSLASLLTINTALFMFVLGLFLIRVPLLKWYRKLSKTGRIACAAVLSALTILLALYINFALRSVITNSNISFNLSRVSAISVYSITCLLSFALLFTSLLQMLQMSITSIFGKRVVNLSSWKFILIYLAAIALYSTLTIYYSGLKKEFNSNRVWTDKLSIDRDLSLEMQLRMIESGLKNDQIIAFLSFYPEGGGDIIRNRILERYMFRSFSSRYNLAVTTCDASTQLIIDRNTPALNCLGFYSDELRKYGIPLSNGSSFFYLNNFNGKTSYLGLFTYVNNETLQTSNLYIEIESRILSDKGTNMSGILFKQSSDLDLPPYYSYAKYSSGKLVSYSGRESFPTMITPDDTKAGYYLRRSDKHIRFINKVSDDDIVIISRPVPGFMRHVVLFSYLLLLFALVIIPITSPLRKNSLLSMPRNSYKRRITSLMLFSIMLSLACVGIGTIVFTVQRNKRANERNMVRNMEIVQSTLADYCQYTLRYTEIATPQMLQAMESLASSTGNDINIYDTHGRMVCSTQPELYNQSIMGSRMDHEAFTAIVEKSLMNYIGQESIAGNSFQSIYAPLYNIDGDMVAIANIPHVTGQSQFQQEGSMIVASIVNLYLVILLASILISLMLANSISKPLTQIKQSMERLPRSKKKEHLVYKEGKDEIGTLVAAYNKMVDDLDESTRRLARTERETAWKEMARQIAHEIKNPLTPMQLNIQLLQRLKRDNDPRWEAKFDEVSRSLLEQIDILSRTASDFSTLSKLLSDEATTTEDLVAILREEEALYASTAGVDVTLETDLEKAPANIHRQQIIRAFMNIIGNAIQAIEEKGGNVLITLLRQGSLYRISVEDDGPGVKEEFIHKLFSPNFTTKVGGSGLGLAICKDIFEQNGGSITYERSQRLGGAAFVVTLPAV